MVPLSYVMPNDTYDQSLLRTPNSKSDFGLPFDKILELSLNSMTRLSDQMLTSTIPHPDLNQILYSEFLRTGSFRDTNTISNRTMNMFNGNSFPFLTMPEAAVATGIQTSDAGRQLQPQLGSPVPGCAPLQTRMFMSGSINNVSSQYSGLSPQAGIPAGQMIPNHESPSSSPFLDVVVSDPVSILPPSASSTDHQVEVWSNSSTASEASLRFDSSPSSVFDSHSATTSSIVSGSADSTPANNAIGNSMVFLAMSEEMRATAAKELALGRLLMEQSQQPEKNQTSFYGSEGSLKELSSKLLLDQDFFSKLMNAAKVNLLFYSVSKIFDIKSNL
ncbi:hypothetical protein Ddc_10986 [Ditylenchus destructor]|nr:hypothetical protein Ddc_10986 [Ditylenchus destructor]